MNDRIGFCSASLTSQTYALKAQRLLSAAGIPSKVIKLDGEKSKMGCSYAIEFSCFQAEGVKKILDSKRVRVRHFYKGDEELRL